MHSQNPTGTAASALRLTLAAAFLIASSSPAARAQEEPTREELQRRLAELDAERRAVLDALSNSDDDAAIPDPVVDAPDPQPVAPPPAATPQIDDLPVALSELDEGILVVAKRFESDPRLATSSITRFGERDIERRQAQRVSDMLREVPGTLVLSDGPAGQFTRIHIRGAATNQTLVLVDGIPQNDATTGGGYDFGDLTTDGVSSIEVLRGSYGILYGSEAIGGVVNVTTRRGSGDPGGFVRVEGGSFDTLRTTAGVSAGDDRFDFAFTLGRVQTDGERDREDHHTNNAIGRFGMQFSRKVRVDVSMRWADSRTESPFDFGFGDVLPEDDNIDRRRETFSTGATVTADLDDTLQVRASASVLSVDSTFDNGPDGPTIIDPDFTPGTGDESSVVRDELHSTNDQTDVRGRLEATWAVSDALGWGAPEEGGVGLELTVGGEYLDQRSESDTTSPDFNAPTSTTTHMDDAPTTGSLFAQTEILLPHLDELGGGVLTLGIRHDDNSEFGDETSHYVGARVFVEATGTVLRSAYGEGFRAPKPSELSDPFVGNIDLGAETSESFDIGAEQTLLDGRMRAGLTWFRLRTDDLIAYDASDITPSRPFGRLANFSRTETEGWEAAILVDLGEGFTLRGTATTQNPRDRETTLNLPNRAKHFGSAGVAYESGPLLVSLDGFFSGKNPDQGGEFVYPEPHEREEPGRRKLVNLTARYRLSDQFTLFGRVQNLLDDDYVSQPRAPAGSPLGVFFGGQFDF